MVYSSCSLNTKFNKTRHHQHPNSKQQHRKFVSIRMRPSASRELWRHREQRWQQDKGQYPTRNYKHKCLRLTERLFSNSDSPLPCVLHVTPFSKKKYIDYHLELKIVEKCCFSTLGGELVLKKYFQYLVIINKTAMNIHLQVSF